jgi:hypothetical protein
MMAKSQAYVLRVASNFTLTLAAGTKLTCAEAIGWLVRDERRWEVAKGHFRRKRQALDIEGKRVTIQGPYPELSLLQLCTFRLRGLGAEPSDP